MSFGFDVGNFADAAHLAYLIYRDCYKVARGAPQEFQLLVSEVSTLSNSLKILQEDVKDPESPLLKAGDDRVKLVNDMVGNIRVTLNKMEQIARKYEIMGSTTASKGKQIWTRFKWTFDWSTIEKLRGKLNQHNTMMSLLLTQIGNSSLQRIQSSTNALESDIHEIRKYIVAQQGHQVGNQDRSGGTPVPFLSLQHDESLVKDDITRSSLSTTLLKHAEMHQPWNTIGVSQWIETGTWWLLRAQLGIRPITTPGSTISKPAYLALIKASWILIDIIACHPQVSFIPSPTRGQIAALSTAIKREFEKVKLDNLTVESLSSIIDEELYIWEGAQGESLSLRPQIASSASSLETTWAVDGEEKCLFLGVAECDIAGSGLNICIVMFLVQANGRASRLVAKQQNGEVMLNNRFTKPVKLDTGSHQVTVDEQKMKLDGRDEALRLSCLIEAASVYHFQRKPSYFSGHSFVSWLSLVAVKNDNKELLSTLHQRFDLNKTPTLHQHDLVFRLYEVARSLVRSFFEGDGNSGPQYDFHVRRSIDARGLSLLYWAIWIGNSPLVKLLMLEGITGMYNPWDILPPLHAAALYGHDAVAHTIIANSSEDAQTLAREKDNHGRTALYHATFYGHEKVARTLLGWTADIDDTSFSKETALHAAAQQGHASVVQLLLDKGAREDARDYYEMTPLLSACEAKRGSVIALFAKNHLDFTFRDKEGRSAWHMALHPPRSIYDRDRYDREISESSFDLIMQYFWAGEKLQMPLPKQRRAIVSFAIRVDTEWVSLTLDSRYAKFEHPGPLPSQAIDRFGRCIEVRRSAGITDKLFRLIIECHIIYACKTLDFSTTHRQLSRNGWIGLKIRGGGGFEVLVRDMNNLGFIFQNHRNIATDPDAEEVSRAAGFW